MASGLKSEISKKLLDINVSAFSMAPVKVCGLNLSDVSRSALSNLYMTIFVVPYSHFFHVLLSTLLLICVIRKYHRGDMHLSDLTYLWGRIMFLRSITHSRYFTKPVNQISNLVQNIELHVQIFMCQFLCVDFCLFLMKLEFGDYCCILEGLTDKCIVVGPAPSSGFKRRIFLCSARNSLQV